ncbi:MAG: response regulator transcription factor [Comamonadaceae bacterium]|nr:MAG: response regulator transcription factor [Comamonadaceae bacterium]
MTRLRTFLVEDCPVTRDHIADMLEANANARVIGWASTETEASNWLAKNKTDWDLLVIDLFLAEGSGMNVLKASSRRPSQQAIVISNYLTIAVKARCYSMGADGVFDKSTEIDEFVNFARKVGSTNVEYSR